MVIKLCIVFVLMAYISMLDKDKSKLKNIFFCWFGFLLFYIAAFRGPGIDRDYSSYVTAFLNNSPFFVEPTFFLISELVHRLFNDSVIYVFIIYALIGITLKMYAIKKLSHFWFLSLIIYFSYSFILNDMTQIRAGVAAAFILLSIKPLYERKLFEFLILATLASLFHYSAIIIFPIWFLKPNEIKKLLYIIAIPIAYIIHFSLKIDFTFLANIDYFPVLQHKLLAYQPDNSGFLNVFNVWQILRIGISCLLIWKANLIFKKNVYGYLFIKLYVISTCAYVILAFNPSFAGRIGDLFAIGDIVTIPFLVYIIRPKNMARIIVILIGFSYLFLNLFYNKIIT